MKISTDSLKKIQDIETEIFDHEKEKAALAGYTVTPQGIVGKNQLTGEDAPDCQLTVCYSEIVEQGGKFYIDDIQGFNPKGDYVRELKPSEGEIVGKV